jgi:hypothetical protein
MVAMGVEEQAIRVAAGLCRLAQMEALRIAQREDLIRIVAKPFEGLRMIGMRAYGWWEVGLRMLYRIGILAR